MGYSVPPSPCSSKSHVLSLEEEDIDDRLSEEEPDTGLEYDDKDAMPTPK